MENATTIRQTLKKLDVQRTSLQMEADAIISELTAVPTIIDSDYTGPYQEPKPMGIDTPLVDDDGFPRSDIDVVRARTLRHRLAEIKTDYKTCMKQVEEGLIRLRDEVNPEAKQRQEAEITARTQPTPKPTYNATTGRWTVSTWNGTIVAGPGLLTPPPPQPSTDTMEVSSQSPTTTTAAMETTTATTTTTTTTPIRPFAKVDGIASPEAPAALAGLQEGDLMLQFGSIVVPANATTTTITNSNPLNDIAELLPQVAANEQSLTLVVLRQKRDDDVREAVTLELFPKPWGGRGVLGCHIVPYNDEEES